MNRCTPESRPPNFSANASISFASRCVCDGSGSSHNEIPEKTCENCSPSSLSVIVRWGYLSSLVYCARCGSTDTESGSSPALSRSSRFGCIIIVPHGSTNTDWGGGGGRGGNIEGAPQNICPQKIIAPAEAIAAAAAAAAIAALT